MNIAEAKQQIKDTVEAYLSQDETGAYLISGPAQRPLFLLGAPGIGKTAVVDQVAHELGIGVVSYSMTHHTRQSALGLPFIVHKSYGEEEFDVSEYTMSEIIASIYDYAAETGHDRGILFLDEINCVSETLYPSMLQFLQFKTFGRHRVPRGWIVVCAGNPPEYNKSVHDFDVVTLDRMRKIVVEPDLNAWLDYARATGVHPAVTSYLEVRRDDFYLVESTPAEKRFVTARSWDDLSTIMNLYEAQGRQVGAALISQYLQDDRIADHFTQYYRLFTKYRSDYQVPDILQGQASPEVRQRAVEARFDERLALLNLILEALDARCEAAMEDERRVALLRDALRNLKPELLAGAEVRPLMEAAAEELRSDARKQVRLEAATDIQVRPLRLAARRLGDYAVACEVAEAPLGQESFDIIGAAYRADAEALRNAVHDCGESLDSAFTFIADTFGDDKEMAVFVAELTGNSATSRFIATFGNESYYAHNAGVQTHANREALLSRVAALNLEDGE